MTTVDGTKIFIFLSLVWEKVVAASHVQSNKSVVNYEHLPETERSAGPRPRGPERRVQTIYWRGCDEKVIFLQRIIQARMQKYSVTFLYTRFQATIFLYNPKPQYLLQTSIIYFPIHHNLLSLPSPLKFSQNPYEVVQAQGL